MLAHMRRAACRRYGLSSQRSADSVGTAATAEELSVQLEADAASSLMVDLYSLRSSQRWVVHRFNSADKTYGEAVVEGKMVNVIRLQLARGEGVAHGLLTREHLFIYDRRRIQRTAGLTTAKDDLTVPYRQR